MITKVAYHDAMMAAFTDEMEKMAAANYFPNWDEMTEFEKEAGLALMRAAGQGLARGGRAAVKATRGAASKVKKVIPRSQSSRMAEASRLQAKATPNAARGISLPGQGGSRGAQMQLNRLTGQPAMSGGAMGGVAKGMKPIPRQVLQQGAPAHAQAMKSMKGGVPTPKGFRPGQGIPGFKTTPGGRANMTRDVLQRARSGGGMRSAFAA